MRNKYLLPIIAVSILVNLLLAWQVWAGSPDSPSAPTATSSYTLQDLYNRLTAGTAGTQSVFTEPSTAPGAGTMRTLNEIMAAAPALDNTNGATSTQVLSDQTFWGLTGGQWGPRTGTMPNNEAVTLVPTTTNVAIAAGYHNGSGYVQGDTDLAAGNIRSGVNLFGVAGSLIGVSGNAGVPKTGQTTSYATGDDGDLERGVIWPNPRFTDNSDGTVTDNLTGLTWLQNANCFGIRNWATALTDANTLNSGECGLSDGSAEGDWRLPNVRELQSLVDYGRYNPALPSGHPFSSVQSNYYWSGSTHANNTSIAWVVSLADGIVTNETKTLVNKYVWLVRGG